MVKPIFTLPQVVSQLTFDRTAWNPAAVIGYRFYTQVYPHLGNPPNFSAFSAAQRQAVADIFTLVSDLVPLRFGEVPDTGPPPGQGSQVLIGGTIAFFNVDRSTVPFWGAATNYDTPAQGDQFGVISGAEVVVNLFRANAQGNWNPGDSNVRKLTHEILHTLGLSHPGEYNGDVALDYENEAEYLQDSVQYTVMSYWGAFNTGADHVVDGVTYHAATPLLHDIAALQALYGANMATRTGDTVYGFNSTAGRAAYDIALNPKPIFSIWDAGGLDTLDLSGFASDSRIDLREGAFSDAGGLTQNISIAFGVTVENAVGGSGNDSVTGNQASNRLDFSRGGIDTVFGLGGNDGFVFGAAFTADDKVDGGEGGNDQVALQGDYSAGLTFGPQSLVNVETVLVLPGFDYKLTSIDANVAPGGRLQIFGTTLGAGDDLTFDGSAETDGHFVFYGGAGKDTLTGGNGNDGFYFGPGNFSGTDTLHGGAGSNDQLGLDGHYSLTLGGNFDGIETLVLYRGPEGDLNRFNLSTSDAVVTAGQRLTIFGTPLGTDLIFNGSAESDGSFRFLGGAGNDMLTGGQGSDVFFGARGGDTMNGGGGNDVFIYNSPLESTAASFDKILGFNAGDILDLSGIDANSTTGANDAFAFIGSDAFSGVAGQLRTVQSASGWTIEGDTDGDKVADLLISVTTDGGNIVAPGDFVF